MTLGAQTRRCFAVDAIVKGRPALDGRRRLGAWSAADTLGRGTGGVRPGRLVSPDDASALAAALRIWLSDGEARLSWRRAARERRATLSGWSTTTSVLAGVLAEAAR